MACKDCKYYAEVKTSDTHVGGLCSVHNYGVMPDHSCDSFTALPARAVHREKKTKPTKYPKRKGMNIAYIVCLVFAAIYAIMALSEDPLMIPAALLFGTAAVIFGVLARSPRYNPYILGRDRGLKKWQFVVICVVVSYILTAFVTAVFFSATTVSESVTVTNIR